jgi:hypothetical protein
MECPFCLHDIPDNWQPLLSHTDDVGRVRPQPVTQIVSHYPAQPGTHQGASVVVTLEWLLCQNRECKQVIVRASRNSGLPGPNQNENWIAVPKRPSLPIVDPLVGESLRDDYLEAWTILDDSPRMSSVLSRRVLADLLKKYAGAIQFSLAKRIDSFVVDTKHPSRLRENLHYLREIGDFSAHTQEVQTPELVAPPPPPQAAVTPASAANQEPPTENNIINVTKEEAEWTLKIVADLFDYFIVDPEKDKKLRAAMDEKIQKAGRRPIA